MVAIVGYAVSERNVYVIRLKRVLRMHAGLVVTFEEFERRVFAEQRGCRQHLGTLVCSLRKQGWVIQNVREVGYRLVSEPELR